MNSPHDNVRLTIDNRPIEVPRGFTILQAAQAAGLYIPTLCAHKDLTPYGGCRMCIVEVEGMRGFPTSCTTPAEAGMIVRTQTAQIQSIRNEIFNLILSEHPCSCLICDEKDECRKYSPTIRKVGVITGCRFCPNDTQCELQEVADRIGVTELNYPIYYRSLPVEKDDPFYDRDYNLCILCGRCVRICQEVRTANAIAFKQRGRHTVIGPAFARTHREAGCEFCGACVSVCPTGALSEKTRKWRGREDRTVTTTCMLCGMGCRIDVLVKQGEVMGVLPAEVPDLNDGQLCVKGRFCIPETVNTYKRVKRYQKLEDGVIVDITPEEGLALAAEKLAACDPDAFGLIISPDCTNEDFYVAQKFVRQAVGSNHIDTAARRHYGPGFGDYVNLFSVGGTLDDLRQASVIVAVGLDARYGRSVIGVELRQAMRRGTLIVTIHPRRHSLSVIADVWLKPSSPVSKLLKDLAALVAKPGAAVTVSEDKDKLDQAASILREAGATVILVGSEFTHDIASGDIYRAIDNLAKTTHARILPLPAAGNLVGSIRMGAYPELSPGGGPGTGTPLPWNGLAPDTAGKKLDVLYLIGEDPTPYRDMAEFVISQNSYPAVNPVVADLIFPAAAFTEVDGTMINQEGRLLSIHRCVDPPGNALPDWQILSRLAACMGKGGFDYATVEDVQAEIGSVVPGFGDGRVEPLPTVTLAGVNIDGESRGGNGDRLPTVTMILDEHLFRGYPLSRWVGGLRVIQPVDALYVNPADADRLGLVDGENVVASADGFERVWPVIIDNEQPSGHARVAVDADDWGRRHGLSITIRKQHG